MKPKNACISLCFCAAGVVVLGGCHESASAGAATTTSAPVIDNSQAINSITYARCSRENACNDIGSDKKYATFDACVKELGHDTGITLRVDKCPQGVLADRLDGCLNDIRTERCGNPIDTIERIASCRKGMLCKGQL